MPELRYDPIRQCWVSIAIERGMRPSDFVKPVDETSGGGFCPFCQGNEHVTPPEVYALRPDGSPPNGPGWELRVVTSKFRALAMEGELNREFERGMGFYVNFTPPEEAASYLREAGPPEVAGGAP